MAFGLRKGDVFAGRYQVERLLAAGGMGAVYEVLHLDTQRRRALKVMLPHVLENDEMRERFKREALVAAGVESEFIVDVFDAGVDKETRMPFLVMELLRGEELGKRVKRSGKLDPAEALAYLHQIARALDKMHAGALVHRDLKPENVFLADRDEGPPRVKLLDFGVAKVVAEAGSAAGATEVVGTPSYMAPEQFQTGLRITGAADVYALGLCAYTLLVGTPYWYDETTSGNAFAVALAAAHGPSEPASVRATRRGAVLPPGFDAWFATITAVDPSRRYPSAGVAVRSLAQVLGVSVSLLTTSEGLPLVDPSGEGSHPPEPLSEGVRAPVTGSVLSLGLPSDAARLRHPESPWRWAPLALAMMALGGALALALTFWPRSQGRASSTDLPAPTLAPPTAAGAASAPAAPAAPATSDSPDAGVASQASPPSALSALPASRGTPVPKSTPRTRPTAVYSQE